EALDVAQRAINTLCDVQHRLVEEKGDVVPFEFQPVTAPDALIDRIYGLVGQRMSDHIRAPYEKQAFYSGIGIIEGEVLDQLLGPNDPEGGLVRAATTEEGYTEREIREAVATVERR